MYDTAYEILKFPVPTISIFCVCACIGLGIGFLKCLRQLSIARKEKNIHDISINSFLIVVILVACVFFAIALIDSFEYGGSEEYYFAKEYYAGNYECVEGQVYYFTKKFDKEKGYQVTESFFVKDVFFEYNDVFTFCFLNINQTIKHDGQQVRIYYIPYCLDDACDDWRNIIVRVDVKKE